jgi:glycosyltransferase involved in cell wall biosynthesis
MEAGVPDVRARRPSGAANHVLQTVKELKALGHDVRLVACLERGIWTSDDLERYRPVWLPSLDAGANRLIERGIRRIQWQLRLPYFAFFDSQRFARACVQELFGFDVIYERMGWMGLGGSLAAARLGVPHVLEVNGDLLPELAMNGMTPGPVQRAVSSRLMRQMIRRVSHTVATGEGWRARHIEQWHVPPETVSVVHNGTELVHLVGRHQLRAFREDSSDDRPLHVGFVGSFDPWQGLPLLLSAVATALASGINLRLTLAGTGSQESALREQATMLGLSERVEFAGHLPMARLASHMADWDVGVCLYRGRAEYTGLKLLDYKAAGLAVIAAGEAGQPALIDHDVTGIIIPPGDQDALCAALAQMDAARERVHAMGRRARLEAEERHGWSHTARALQEVFERAFRQLRPSAA